MNSFFSIFLHAWSCLFSDKKSFLTIFFFQFLPFVLIFGSVVVISGLGYVLIPRYADVILAQLSNLPLFIGGATIFFILMLVALIFQLVCSYLSTLGLVYIFQNKNFTVRSLISEWRGMWPWAGTGLVLFCYFFIIFIVTFFLTVAVYYFGQKFVGIPLVLGFLVSIGLGVFLSLSYPVYFFEARKYFQASRRSFEIIRGRWWQTFGYLCIIVAGMIIVTVLFNFSDVLISQIADLVPQNLSDSTAFGVFLFIVGIAYALTSSVLSMILQIFFTSFSFAMYFAYNGKPAVIPVQKNITRLVPKKKK